ncbi:MAG: polyprenyl diphosphate synthase [Thermoleophilia bacterium]|nr:polyprenyl diphosphate synthase [Thermoleophilia bacterium]
MAGLRNLFGNLRRSRTESEDFLLDAENTPHYVAVIMDGNGRWAQRRHMPAIAGHREGAKALKRTIKAARQAGIRELTVYAFSTENWQRPEQEVDDLMKMFGELIDREVPELAEKDVRVRFIGRRQDLSEKLLGKMEWAEKLSAANSTMSLYIAFNYGGRSEIIDAARAAAGNGLAAGEDVDFSKYLYAPEMHDPELLIRTSGEQRVSNFLLWQCAYCELYFSEKLWPDFGEQDLLEALAEFGRRQRRFGAR